MPELLNQSDIEEKLEGLTGWEKDGDTITRTFEFEDFIESMEFVNKLVNPAETMNHHPDITISYNTVTLSLTTHSEGGLTENDIELAGQINTIK